MSTAPKRPGERFRVLDSLRGLGAILVVLFHVEILNHAIATPWFRQLMSLMDFFFVLSGFVISYGFYERITSGRQAAGYMIRRVGRIWPLHVAILALFVALEGAKLAAGSGLGTANAAFTGAKSVPALLANIGMVQAWGLFPTPTWNYPSWSISAEFVAYMGFGLFALLRPRRPLLVAAATIAISIAIMGRFAPNDMNSDVDFGVERCLAGFFTGHLVYRLHKAIVPGRRWRLPFATLVEAGAFLAFYAFVAHVYEGPISLTTPLFYAVFTFIFCLEDGLISQCLRHERLRLLGEWSYSIYMIHAFLLVLVTGGLAFASRLLHLPATTSILDQGRPLTVWDIGGLWGGDIATALFVILVVAVSAKTYRYIEVPFRAMFNGWASRIEKGGRHIQPGHTQEESSPPLSKPPSLPPSDQSASVTPGSLLS